jgi:COP9 signalosome complex subunit 1
VVLYNEALQLAASEAKQGKDTELYSRVVETWQAIDWTNSNARKDENWILKTTRENKAESVRLESELKGYKNNLIKESIRVCQQRVIAQACC